MNCSKFPDRPAAGVCSYSGKPFCQEELVEIFGKMVAKDNLEKFMGEQKKIDAADTPKQPNPMVFMNAGGGGASSSSSSSSGGGGFFSRISCADWILVVCTGGLWLIVVFIKSLR